MKKLLLSPLMLMIILVSCENNDVNDLPKFTPGDVIIRYKIYTPLDSIYALVDSYNLVFDEILTYSYIVNTTPDSIPYYTHLLLQKPYLGRNVSHPKVILENGVISAHISFNSLNDSQAADWFNFKNENRFMHHPETYTREGVAFLKVPIGQEEYWAGVLRQSPHLVLAEVNHIYYIEL